MMSRLKIQPANCYLHDIIKKDMRLSFVISLKLDSKFVEFNRFRAATFLKKTLKII